VSRVLEIDLVTPPAPIDSVAISKVWGIGFHQRLGVLFLLISVEHEVDLQCPDWIYVYTFEGFYIACSKYIWSPEECKKRLIRNLSSASTKRLIENHLNSRPHSVTKTWLNNLPQDLQDKIRAYRVIRML